MAEYNITIKDEDGGVSILLAGPAGADSAASTLAQALVGLAPKVLIKAAQQKKPCDCEKCRAERAAATPSNTTIH